MNASRGAWLQLRTAVTGEQAGTAEAALSSVGALAVTLQDAADAPVLEPAPGETPLWPSVVVTGLFPGQRDPLELLASLAAAGPGLEWHPSLLADRLWEREWMRDFRPMRFGSRLWIVPSGHAPAPAGVVLRLDPGLAFGTGTHPTTALCLEWLDELAGDGHGLAGATVVDYGCGSGVLAIAAVLLGAERAVGVDTDPQALLATTANARMNGVSESVSAVPPDGLDAALSGRQSNVLVANILAGALAGLAGEFARITTPGGQIALSGILAGQQEPVLSACAPCFRMDEPGDKAGWLRLTGIREEV